MVRSVAIVEDIRQEADRLREYVGRYAAEKDIEFKVALFESGEQFLNGYRPVYDVVFLDIGLPQMNGMDVAVRLRETDESVLIIFVTNMAQYAVRGYEVNAFDFVVKPVTYANFALKLQRILNRLGSRRDTEVIITAADNMYRVSPSQIKYIEISDHKIIYHTTTGTLHTYGSLKEVEEGLNDKVFVRCNSCYLVNLNYVYAIRGYVVVVGSEELQISRPRKKAFLKAVNDYLGGGI